MQPAVVWDKGMISWSTPHAILNGKYIRWCIVGPIWAPRYSTAFNMGYFISSVIGPWHPPIALHAMYCTTRARVLIHRYTQTRSLRGKIREKDWWNQSVICPVTIFLHFTNLFCISPT
jgi:hypothetical protein